SGSTSSRKGRRGAGSPERQRSWRFLAPRLPVPPPLLPVTRTLSILGWPFILVDLVAAAALILRRDTGDAATRGLGQGLGALLAALGVVAAVLLWAGRARNRPLVMLAGCVLAAAPVALGVVLTVSRQGLALIYPSLR